MHAAKLMKNKITIVTFNKYIYIVFLYSKYINTYRKIASNYETN